MPPTRLFAWVALLLPPAATVVSARESKPDVRVSEGVTFRAADIMSEGTRMSAEVFAPEASERKKLPTIIMSHGWGGIAEHLRSSASAFAKAGYLVITFDYRGWGKSDSRLILAGTKPEKKDGKLVAEVKEVREVVDPIDQTADIMNVIHWAVGDKQCDPEGIGIWGSSYSGGHVVYVAARDPRVKAFVSQVGAMDSRWTIVTPAARSHTFGQGTSRTRGEIGYPSPGSRFMNMNGQPVWEKLMQYAPIEDIGRCKDCAKLFIIAENEELFDNRDHAILAYERGTGVKKLVTIPGIKHYGIYNEARGRAEKEAIAWFDEHLKKGKAIVVAQADPTDGWNPLFNGKDLTGWYTFLQKHGKNKDPDRVITIEDGAIHLYKHADDASNVVMGYIGTEKEYGDYHLRFQYRWGEKKFEPRYKLKRDAGLYYHILGPDAVWPRALQFQVEQTNVGDLITLYGFQLDSWVDLKTHAETMPTFLPPESGGQPTTMGGKGLAYQKHLAGDHEVEGWNTAEIIAKGTTTAHILNGKVVNRGKAVRLVPEGKGEAVSVTRGRIALEIEAAEIFFRNVEIRYLTIDPASN